VALQQLEGRARGVGLDLVVAAEDRHVPPVLDPHLGRAQDVAGWVQRQAIAVEVEGLAVLQQLDRCLVSQARPEDMAPFAGRQVMPAPLAGVIGVRVGDDGALHGAPGVDVESAGLAGKAPVCHPERKHDAVWHKAADLATAGVFRESACAPELVKCA
jgi:hypothetical protein